MLEVAVDDPVISNYVAENLQGDLLDDKNAFKEMISLAKQGNIELGKFWDTPVRPQELKGIIKDWPIPPDPDPQKTNEQIACLYSIMQDPNRTYSEQLVRYGRLTQARYFVTVNYPVCDRFNAQKKNIINQCGINMFVMRPSDFMRDYEEGKIPY